MNDMRQRYVDGESTATLAAEAGISRVQMWRRLGRPARYLLDAPAEAVPVAVAAWAAGFFDGEGTVSIGEKGRVQVYAAQTVEAPLQELLAVFGGSVAWRRAANERHREQWLWRASGPVAGRFLIAVQPYLRVKHRHAVLALAVLGLPGGRGRRLDAYDLAERASFHEAIALLNLRGPGRA